MPETIETVDAFMQWVEGDEPGEVYIAFAGYKENAAIKALLRGARPDGENEQIASLNLPPTTKVDMFVEPKPEEEMPSNGTMLGEQIDFAGCSDQVSDIVSLRIRKVKVRGKVMVVLQGLKCEGDDEELDRARTAAKTKEAKKRRILAKLAEVSGKTGSLPEGKKGPTTTDSRAASKKALKDAGL